MILIKKIYVFCFLLGFLSIMAMPVLAQVDKAQETCNESMKGLSEIGKLETYLKTKILGQDELLRALFITLLIRGNILIEGTSGLGKSTAIKALANSFSDADFKKIIFRPDLLPGEITGTEREISAGKMTFNQGPIFTNFVLADEINRSYAKTQSALLEAMEEREVTVGKKTYPLPLEHFVFATQNGLDDEGTNPLPEAQLDRFDIQFNIEAPDEETELAIARKFRKSSGVSIENDFIPIPLNVLAQSRLEMQKVELPDSIEKYIVKLVRYTRNLGELLPEFGDWVLSGASPRGTMSLMNAVQANAYLEGRTLVVLDDVKLMAYQVLGHRIKMSPLAVAEEKTPQMVIQAILEKLKPTDIP